MDERVEREFAELVKIGTKAMRAAKVAVPGKFNAYEKIRSQNTVIPGATGEAVEAAGAPGTGGAPEVMPTFSFTFSTVGLM